MQVSVLADGDEEREVEHADQGGEGGVAGDPDPLQVPGKLLPYLDIHLEALLSLSPSSSLDLLLFPTHKGRISDQI